MRLVQLSTFKMLMDQASAHSAYVLKHRAVFGWGPQFSADRDVREALSIPVVWC